MAADSLSLLNICPSWNNTSSEVGAVIIYIVIPTTKDRRGRLKELVASIETSCEDVHYSLLVFENSLGGWVPAIWNAISGLKDDQWVWLLGTDCIVEPGALSTLFKALNKSIPGDTFTVAEPYNELHGDTLCQHPLTKAGIVRKYLDPRLTHWYSDNLFTDLAKRDNALIYVPEAKIQHNHFVNGKAPKDKTYETIFNPITVEKDRQIYIQLRKEYGL